MHAQYPFGSGPPAIIARPGDLPHAVTLDPRDNPRLFRVQLVKQIDCLGLRFGGDCCGTGVQFSAGLEPKTATRTMASTLDFSRAFIIRVF